MSERSKDDLKPAGQSADAAAPAKKSADDARDDQPQPEEKETA